VEVHDLPFPLFVLGHAVREAAFVVKHRSPINEEGVMELPPHGACRPVTIAAEISRVLDRINLAVVRYLLSSNFA